MSRPVVREIFKKEVIDILRDRRALMVMMVLPIVLYPALFGGLTWIQKRQQELLQEREVKIQLRGADELPLIAEALKEIPRSSFEDFAEPEKAITEGKLDALLELEPLGETGRQASLTVYYNSSQDTSMEAYRRLLGRLQVMGEEADEAYKALMEKLNLSASDTATGPLAAFTDEIPPSVKFEAQQDLGTGGGVLGRMLAMMLVVMSVSGAMYPALDLGAGEKERGTMETILAAPVKRHQIVLGKYWATAAIAGVTAVVNLVVMAATFKWMASQATGSGSAGVGQLTFDLETFLVVLVVLAPLVMLFSAASLALSTFARSYKEAQSYVTPLMVIGMVPAMAAIAPGIELNLWTGLAPVLSTVLLFRDQMAGLASWGDTGLVFVSTCIYAAFALWWAVRIYHREEVLFRA